MVFEDEPKRGLRIDLIMASHGLLPRVKDAGVDYDLRGMEKNLPTTRRSGLS
ncbi:hypothetical protein ACFS4T_23700 [Pseudomonas lini]